MKFNEGIDPELEFLFMVQQQLGIKLLSLKPPTESSKSTNSILQPLPGYQTYVYDLMRILTKHKFISAIAEMILGCCTDSNHQSIQLRSSTEDRFCNNTTSFTESGCEN